MTMSCNDDHPAFKTDWDRAHEQHQQPLPALVPKYERMRQALAEVVRVDEAKDIADQASALRAYARMRHDHEAELLMVEIKLRAYRRIGELSAELEKSNGGRGKTLPAAGKSFKKDTLAKSGIFNLGGAAGRTDRQDSQAAFDSVSGRETRRTAAGDHSGDAGFGHEAPQDRSQCTGTGVVRVLAARRGRLRPQAGTAAPAV